MKNIVFRTLLTVGLVGTSEILITAPAFADAASDRRQRESNNQQQQNYRDRQNQQIDNANKFKPAPSQPTYQSPSNTSSPIYRPSNGSSGGSYSTPSSGSSGSSDSSGLEGIGAIFSLFNFGPSAVSSNGNIQYGVQSKFGFENIRVRTAMHFGSGSSINGAFTYSLNGQQTMFNPFIGGGIGYKTIQKPGKIDTDAFAFYGTGGVDLNLTDNLSISGAVNLPTDSAYGTEFQAAINFFGSF